MPKECKDCFFHGKRKDGTVGCSNPHETHPDDEHRCVEFVRWDD